MLGIVKKHHNHLESQCDAIDKEIAEEITESHLNPEGAFGLYVKGLRRLKKQLNQKYGEFVFVDENNVEKKQILWDQVDALEEEIEQIRTKVYPTRVQSLEVLHAKFHDRATSNLGD